MIPTARQRVRVDGHPGMYFVLTANYDLGYAELVELNSATLLEAVKFERILPLRPESEANEPMTVDSTHGAIDRSPK